MAQMMARLYSTPAHNARTMIQKPAGTVGPLDRWTGSPLDRISARRVLLVAPALFRRFSVFLTEVSYQRIRIEGMGEGASGGEILNGVTFAPMHLTSSTPHISRHISTLIRPGEKQSCMGFYVVCFTSLKNTKNRAQDFFGIKTSNGRRKESPASFIDWGWGG